MSKHRRKKSRLRNLKVREVSSVDGGANPGADVLIYKSEHRDPESFDDVQERRILEQAAHEIGRRIDDLNMALFSILFTDEEEVDLEALIRESLAQFKGSIDGDLKSILDGSFKKTSGDGPPGDTGGHKMPKIDKAKLADLDEDVRKYVEELEAQMGGIPDLEAKAAGLEAEVKKAGEDLKAAKEELQKAKGEPDPNDKKIDKDALPEPARKRLEELEKREQEAAKKILELEKRDRLNRMLQKVAAWTHLPGKPEEIAAELVKADEAGMLETIEKAFQGQHDALQKAKTFEELGSAHGDTGGGGFSKLEGIAQELKKADPKLSNAQAFTKAMEEHPGLYQEYLKERPAAN